MGIPVTLIEGKALLAGQSSHSHGYLHRGFIYLEPSFKLVRDLREGSDRWENLLLSNRVDFESRSSIVAFASEADRATVQDLWPLRGMDVDSEVLDSKQTADLDQAFGLRRAAGGMARTSEKVISVKSMAEALATPNRADCRTVKGTVLRLRTKSDRVEGLVVKLDDEIVELTASLYIITAGIGSLPLAKEATGASRWLVNRQSYMLVLQGKDLPRCSAVFPGTSRQGLFIGSRVIDRTAVWLVSDFVSYAGLDQNSVGMRLWLRNVYRNLNEVSTVLEDGRAEMWGIYPAPKAEFRSGVSLEGASIDDFGLTNMIVALPTKLTLAPLLGELVCRWTKVRLGATRGFDQSELGHSGLSSADETWQSCQLYDLGYLKDVLEGAAFPRDML
jgi:glycine/D-amino acid oxidase-like deaminating enzyme